jgi:UbiD family decarboxylase
MTADPPQSFDSLRDYIAAVEERGELQHIEGADWDLEIGAISEVVAHSDPRALLFDDVTDYPEGYRVGVNFYGTPELQALGLGIDPGGSPVDMVQRWRAKTSEMDPIPPKAVDDGPVRENVMTGDDVDVTKFPTPFWHEDDGGRYFGTGDAFFTRGPEGDWINTAVYRNQIHEEDLLGLLVVPTHHAWEHLRAWWDRDEDAPVVITAGQSPHVFASACLPLPHGQTEIEYAGGLKGEPIEVIEHEESGLPVPAHAEIAVIGRVPDPEKHSRLEGPFGECGGYYAGGEDERPVVEIDEIWHRDDPILQGNPPLAGSASEHALGAEIVSSARIWDSIEDDIPNIQGVWAVYQECQKGVDFTAISIEQEYAGHAKQAAAAVLGSYPNVTGNNAVLVMDEDLNPDDTEDVLFALTSRCDPHQDIDIVRGIPSDGLDARIHPDRKADDDMTTSSMLIDATKPYHWKDEYPTTNMISQERWDQTMDEWNLDDW